MGRVESPLQSPPRTRRTVPTLHSFFTTYASYVILRQSVYMYDEQGDLVTPSRNSVSNGHNRRMKLRLQISPHGAAVCGLPNGPTITSNQISHHDLPLSNAHTTISAFPGPQPICRPKLQTIPPPPLPTAYGSFSMACNNGITPGRRCPDWLDQ